MHITSPAFAPRGDIPEQYVMPGAGGDNVSIPYTWEGVPKGTKSLALSLVDPHPVANNWVHWLVVNIPPGTRSLPEGTSGRNMPPGSVELQNSFGRRGYGGPQPPKGTGDHPYVATLYALDVPSLNLPPATSLEAFHRAIKGHVLASDEYTGMFGRK